MVPLASKSVRSTPSDYFTFEEEFFNTSITNLLNTIANKNIIMLMLYVIKNLIEDPLWKYMQRRNIPYTWLHIVFIFYQADSFSYSYKLLSYIWGRCMTLAKSTLSPLVLAAIPFSGSFRIAMKDCSKEFFYTSIFKFSTSFSHLSTLSKISSSNSESS